jgi:hypothetical protein
MGRRRNFITNTAFGLGIQMRDATGGEIAAARKLRALRVSRIRRYATPHHSCGCAELRRPPPGSDKQFHI